MDARRVLLGRNVLAPIRRRTLGLKIACNIAAVTVRRINRVCCGDRRDGR
jgi:hypothetical protein